MPKTLFIAEKPSVAREIARLLKAEPRGRRGFLEGPDCLISWAVGHLVGIAEPEEHDPVWAGRWNLKSLPILPKRFKLAVLPKTMDQFELLRELMHRDDVSDLVNATDAGREGELIFRRIYLLVGCAKPVRRLWANDMTEEGLRKSLNRLMPDAEKRNLGLASFARAEADWLVGMNFSRLFTLKAGSLLSVGRVQTPVLRMLADRRADVADFVPKDYWIVEGKFAPAKATAAAFTAEWRRPPEYTENRLAAESEAAEIIAACTDAPARVDSVEKKPGTTKPPLPYDLTTLQREANDRFGFSAKETLDLAQNLYESRKLITYPRTDSRHLTAELFADILKHLRAVHHMLPQETAAAAERIKAVHNGAKNLFACVDDKKVTDHHAIIPTAVVAKLEALPQRERDLYDLVCRRFVAAFSPAASFSSTTVAIAVNDQRFVAKGKVFQDRGWLTLEPWRSDTDTPLPALRKGETLATLSIAPSKRKTKAPQHFTDATLLAAMETAGSLVEDDELRLAMKERGLGTPATRAQIIEVLLQRGYIQKDGKKLIATDNGMQAAELVATLLPDLSSPELTGRWEKKLKDMEAGSFSYPEFLREIRTFVEQGVTGLKNRNIDALLDAAAARHSRPPDGNCPFCGGKVAAFDQGWRCEHHAGGGKKPPCAFRLPTCFNNLPLTEEMIRQLLESGRTRPLDFISKQGKPYNAALVLRNGRLALAFAE